MPHCTRLTRLMVAIVATLTLADEVVASPVANLHTSVRGGQVFVTWTEADTPAGTTFNVYVAERPITHVGRARRAAHHIEAHSARDWWADPASFDGKAKPSPPVGWQLDPGRPRLDPQGGLFVYTVSADDPQSLNNQSLYFAVTTVAADGREDTTVVAGDNTTTDGVTAKPGLITAFWQLEKPEPPAGAGRRLPSWMRLHGKSGVVAGMEYLAFGDGRMGWRAGLPFKFAVRIVDGAVVIQPTDRAWVNRPHKDSNDGRAPAIWTFWFGYNSHIYDPAAMSSGVPTNYTEHRLLWILDFVARRYETDRARCYLSGGSMGGCGTISFGLRHPELFAALHAHVPIVSYTYEGTASASRLEFLSWTGPITPDVPTSDGLPLLERMNGVRLVNCATGDLPYLFMVHGRKDGSIPWQNNPAFYQALADRRQGYSVYWDEGTHPTAGDAAPSDVKAWLARFRRFRLDESFPVFGRATTDRNPGAGRPDDGDPIGWMNRGFDWSDITDDANRYAISITAAYEGIKYPVRADVALRRLQRFHPAAGEKLQATIGNAPQQEVTVNEAGLLVLRNVTFMSSEPVKIVVTK